MTFVSIGLRQTCMRLVCIAAVVLAASWVLCGNSTVLFGEESPRLIPADEGTVPIRFDWERFDESVLDLSPYLQAPAGKEGFVRVEGSHLVTASGKRLRLWGTNVCGSDCFPDHDQAERIARDFARLGFNIVRFHHLDSTWGRSIFPADSDTTRTLDEENLERLDYFVYQLKQRGIYTNLNLNVLRRYRPGDGVRDYEYLGIGKSATYFNPRLIELQHEYARRLLTHRNRYTGNEYRHEPAVAVVEMVNENSVLEGWVNWRLVGKNEESPSTWSPIPVSYAAELTELYNRWLKENVAPDVLTRIRNECGTAEGELIPRLRPDQFGQASALRFGTEARFYMDVERRFFEGMRRLLRDELGVRSLLVGTADHNDRYAAYAHIASNMVFDYIDGHGYWQHPSLGEKTRIQNTPMVNDPLDSTVVQFARSPVEGLPFTISETNHPFPHEYACEGFPILTVYALFHDWDGIYWFSWSRGRYNDPAAGIRNRGWFDFSVDPMKVVNTAVCGLIWHRKDVAPSRKTVVRRYDEQTIVEALRMDRNESPFFTPGFPRSAGLVHATRFALDGRPSDPFPQAAPESEIVSDTGELRWLDADKNRGVVTVDSPRTQAVVGYVGGTPHRTTCLAPQVETEFAAIVLTSLDDSAITQATRLLLVTTAKTCNTGQKWEADRKTLAEWGRAPIRTVPVTGRIRLEGIDAAGVRAVPLTTVGAPTDRSIPLARSGDGWELELEDSGTLWYVLEVSR
ncbi:hypothetical protein JCM19992_33910 [Thermostilla marina]